MNGEPRTARTYRLRHSTIAMLDDCAARTGIPQSALADHLLAHVLAEYAAGRLTITTRPVVWELAGIHRTG